MEVSRRSLKSGCALKKGLQALGLVLGILLFCLPGYSQLNLGSINGTVTDPSGAVVVGAKVTVTNVDQGTSRVLTTDKSGAYNAPSLIPGNYSVSATYTGFQTLTRSGVTVGVAQAVRVNLTLQPGAQTQTVTVTEAVPIINTTNEVLSSTVESNQLSNLPINGHLYTKILDFQPGVHGNPGGNSPNYQTNGAGGQGNYFLLDGVENTNWFVNSGPLIGAATSTDELTILPQDAVGEVNVMTNPPAEYGWFQGAVVNVGLKSGTNTLHGSAYGFFRNNNFDAFDPYLKGQGVPKQTDDFKQFGGSLGGPIKKDKLFYFGAFDGMRYNVGEGSFVTLPTTSSSASVDNPANSVPLAIDQMINVDGVQPSQLSLNLSDCTVAGTAPSAVATCGNKGVFRYNGTNTNLVGVPGNSFGHSNNVIGKIDYNLNDRNTVNGEYFFGQAVTQTPNTGAPSFWNNQNVSRTQMMRAVWISTPSSTLVNDLRFGYNRYNLADGNAECTGTGQFSSGNVGQPNYTELGLLSGANPPAPFCGFPAVNFNQSGYPSWGALSFFISDQGVFQYTYSINENLSWTHGSQNWKFGFEFHHTRFRGIGAPGYLDGVLNFDGGVAFPGSTDLQDFLAGTPGAGNQIMANSQQLVNTTVALNRYAVYAEDNFRISSRVTADLGLRYELEPAMRVGNNVAGNFDPYSPTGMVAQSGNPLYQTFKTAFAPRAGVAWDITGKGTTVLRAGMGVSYDSPQIDDLLAQSFGAGLNSVPTGFNLYNNSGLVFPASGNPQAVRAAVLSIPGSALNWACNSSSTCPGATYSGGGVPIFPSNLNEDVACGTGNIQVTLPSGNIGTPSPCTLKVRGTAVYDAANQRWSMTTSNARSPMFTWTLGIQHAFTPNTSLTVNYVGTHTYNLATEININQPTPGVYANRADLQAAQPYYSQFPWFNGIFAYGPAGFSNYNALQASFVTRNFHGLTTNVSYTFSRDLATPKGGNNPYIMNTNCVACDYGLRTPTQDLGITLVYQLPGVNGYAQLLKGWQISSTINAQSGVPFTATDVSNDIAGVGGARGSIGGANEVWSIYGNGKNFKRLGRLPLGSAPSAAPCYGASGSFFAAVGCNTGLPAACVTAATNEPTNPNVGQSGLVTLDNLGCYMSANGKSVIVPPAPGTFGNMRPGSLISSPFHEWDLSLRKKFTIRERLGLQFSLSAFNVLNSTNYSLGFVSGWVNLPFLFANSGGNPNGGNPINGTGGFRELLLGVKATF